MAGGDVLADLGAVEERGAWESGLAVAGQVQDRESVLDLVDEGQGKDVDGVVLAVVGQRRFLPASVADGAKKKIRVSENERRDLLELGPFSMKS